VTEGAHRDGRPGNGFLRVRLLRRRKFHDVVTVAPPQVIALVQLFARIHVFCVQAGLVSGEN
jgi:hypothetical protein